MGKFGQFGLNGFKRGQTHFSQIHISLDPDKLQFCVQFSHCNARVYKSYIYGLGSLEVSQKGPQTLMHVIRRFVKSL